MPTFPLPPNLRPLADTPAPVLDREKRPTVDNRNLQHAVGDLAKAGTMPELPAELANHSGLVAIGNAIAQAGSVAEAMASKRQEGITDRQVADADNAISEDTLKFLEYQRSNPDPVAWTDFRKKSLEGVRNRVLTNGNLTPAAKQRIELLFKKRITDELISTQLAADKKIFARARDSFAGNIENAIQARDEPRLKELFAVARGKGYIEDYEEEAGWLRFKQVGKQQDREAKAVAFDAAQNSVVGLAASRGFDAAKQALDQNLLGDALDDADKERLRGIARQVSNSRSAEVINEVTTAIVTGEANSEAKIDALIEDNPHVPPLVRQKMKEDLRQQNLQAEAEDRRVNGIANSVELYQRIKDIRLTGDDLKDKETFYATLAEIKRRVNEDSDGTLSKLLHQKFWGTPPELKPNERVMQNIRETLSSYYDPETGRIPWRTRKKEMVKGPDGKKRVEEVVTIDSKAEERARDEQTRILMMIEERAKADPTLFQDLNKAKQLFRDVMPEGALGGALKAMQGDTAARAAVPSGKITSYGYPNDSTPDSNSKAGIGAWVPDVEQQKIKAGQPSPYRLKAGDIAVSPDIERAFRGKGVKPGGAVMVELANGEVRRVRWMDRTAQDEDILAGRIKGVTQPLRGRFDFYSPNGVHELDGVPVVRWWPAKEEGNTRTQVASR